MTSMDLIFLGTGSAYPTPVRGASCLVFKNDQDCWLFDCGEASQIQLMKSQVKLGKINKIFISHLHGDHIFDVNFTSNDVLHPNEQNGRMIVPNDNQVYQLFEDEKYIVQAVFLKHTVPSFGFVIEEKTPLKKINVDLLKKKNIFPGPKYGKLKSGQSIVSSMGEIINPDEVLTIYPGRKVVIAGDSYDSRELLKIGQNCDVFVHEATLSDEMKEQAFQNGHSTPSEAVKLAIELKAEHLVLTHVSQRYKTLAKSSQVLKEKEPKNDSVSKLLIEAQKTAKEFHSDIQVDIAEDFTIFPVKYKQT